MPLFADVILSVEKIRFRESLRKVDRGKVAIGLEGVGGGRLWQVGSVQDECMVYDMLDL